ncbi:E3 ubiquitin-protein ligase TRIP12 isoform X2 [Nematostella vectensis]|uniref:E3 ubiquitin-protein ligase TRIP12 isoform X2 n=1 Tax=Nematostella vectensis TaxID=45351 RepID=UPI0020778B60|nr:E3 ubiquitin-protein ligase TRIP12 isoform X2 [Nematostella vectensis]
MDESSVEGEQGGTFNRSRRIPSKRKSQTSVSSEFKVEEKRKKGSAQPAGSNSSSTTPTCPYNLRSRASISTRNPSAASNSFVRNRLKPASSRQEDSAKSIVPDNNKSTTVSSCKSTTAVNSRTSTHSAGSKSSSAAYSRTPASTSSSKVTATCNSKPSGDSKSSSQSSRQKNTPNSKLPVGDSKWSSHFTSRQKSASHTSIPPPTASSSNSELLGKAPPTNQGKGKALRATSSEKSLPTASRVNSRVSLSGFGFLRTSLSSVGLRGRDLGNQSSQPGSRASQLSHQLNRDLAEQRDQPKPDGFRRSQKSEATGSCASNSRRGSQNKKRTWMRRQSPNMSASEGSPGRGSPAGQARANEPGQSSSDDRAAGGGDTLQADDGELKDDDMSRLQSLLEARGVPPHLFGSLGPRMHQLLHRASNSGSNSKAQQLLQGIQSSDESQQLQAVIEMCQLLVMGNEESLAGFPVKQVVPALINLLNKEQKFELVNHACRALTYVMESLPRSTVVVVEAVPVFLEKLQVIECMDVAEQSLTALETLSKRHSKSILQAGGLASCLLFLDFFSISAQRSALAIASNCCSSVGPDDFHYIEDAIQVLSSRLQIQDKKSVESCCLAFSRLVDSFQHDKAHLEDLAGHGLLTNIQQLLMISPPLISTATFVMVLRMLASLCANCPKLAVQMIKNNIADTLKFLLVGTLDIINNENVELIARSPQEFYEITCFISELFPQLPKTGVFSVDALLNKSQLRTEHGLWQWRDDRGTWHSYSWIDCKIIEAAFQSGEDELSLSTMGRSYTIDFNALQQINEDTGTTRPIQRCAGAGESTSLTLQSGSNTEQDERIEILQDGPDGNAFTHVLFACLYNIMNSSVGVAVRHKCINAMLRLACYAPSDLLSEILKRHPISSLIGEMLQSNDLRTLVNALQIADILMKKLPDIYHISFRREGVMHKANALASGSFMATTPQSKQTKSKAQDGGRGLSLAGEPYSSHQAHLIQVFEKPPSPPTSRRLGDVFRGKRRSKRTPRSKEKCQSLMEQDLRSEGDAPELSRSGTIPTSSHHHGKSSFFSSLSSSRWSAKASTSSLPADGLPRVDVNNTNSALRVLTSKSSDNKEKIRSWIKEQAVTFYSTYFDDDSGKSHPALDVMQKLIEATKSLGLDNLHDIKALKEINTVLSDSDGVSSFEILHSGLVTKLLSYITPQPSDDGPDLEKRLRVFVQSFMDQSNVDNKPALASLISKLHCCVNQVEQFPVKVHDAPSGTSSSSGSRGSQALRFFSTHQIKCHLQRHPDCKTVRQWKGGPVKIDPLALVQAVERYLVVRGYGRVKEAAEEDGSDDEGSDDDIDESMAFELQVESIPRHHLEIMLGDKVLPYNMTVYQAVKQYGQSDDDRDFDEEQGVLGRPSIWVGQHTIWYRPLNHDGEVSTNNTRHRGSCSGRGPSKSPPKRSYKDHQNKRQSLEEMLAVCQPSDFSLTDPSLEIICLMRAIHILNNNAAMLFEEMNSRSLVSVGEFANQKLAAKVLRQLQDPIAVMTGNFPSWVLELPRKCSFLFPFECRQQLFFCTSFDRERAMSKLQESIPDLINTEMSDRVAPRLDRKKSTVSRKDLLSQAEKIIQDLGSSQSILEIQYQSEVGTGLGPTLEFYALVSKEFQRSSMEMWRGTEVAPPVTEDADGGIKYVYSESGLFPIPIPRNARVAMVSRLKSKFRFLGRFLGRALLDFRMVDIPFSCAFYKWMLGFEATFDYRDLFDIDPVLAKSISQLQGLVRQKHRLEKDSSLTPESLQLAVENLTLDGASVEDLGLDFVLPGYTNIELKKNGRNIPVTIHNLEKYIKLVVHWTLVEGVERQMQAFQEGFDSVFPLTNLKGFSADEMDQLLCGSVGQKWEVKELVESCRPDHGYSHDSRAIKCLFEILSEYDADQQRLFLQFVTGSPRLPVGGFRSLNPPLTIVRKTFEPPLSADNYLPSVMTCVNYLKLPDYTSKEIMLDKLRTAAHEGQRSFHLS